jgi:hypothetical protein
VFPPGHQKYDPYTRFEPLRHGSLLQFHYTLISTYVPSFQLPSKVFLVLNFDISLVSATSGKSSFGLYETCLHIIVWVPFIVKGLMRESKRTGLHHLIMTKLLKEN